MPKIIEKTIYKLDELEGRAKEKALNQLTEWCTAHEWWEYVHEDAKSMGGLLGMDIKKIYFTGFYSQGDGACFEGSYTYATGCIKKIKEYAPNDADLHQIAKQLCEIQRKNFYRLNAEIKHAGHYYHARSTRIDVWVDYPRWGGGEEREAYDHVAESLRETLRDFMCWIYKQLEKEYNRLTSEAHLTEFAEANEYYFDEAGRPV